MHRLLIIDELTSVSLSNSITLILKIPLHRVAQKVNKERREQPSRWLFYSKITTYFFLKFENENISFILVLVRSRVDLALCIPGESQRFFLLLYLQKCFKIADRAPGFKKFLRGLFTGLCCMLSSIFDEHNDILFGRLPYSIIQ